MTLDTVRECLARARRYTPRMSAARATTRHGFWLELAGLFAIYVVTARVGLELDAVAGFATPVWPPTGIAIAALLLRGRKLWPAIALGALVVTLSGGAPLVVALGITLGNTLEAVVAAVLLARVCKLETSLGRTRDVLALLFAGAGVSTLVSATIGAASLWIGGVIGTESLARTWSTWWVGDALGALVVAPLLLVWGSTTRFVGRVAPGLALIAVIVVVTLYIFDVIVPSPEPRELRWPYLVFPVLIYAPLAFRQHGAVTGTFAVWTVSIIATAFGSGPFAASHLSVSLFQLQPFMAAVATTALLLGAAVCERDRARQRAEKAERHNADLYQQAQEAVRARDVFLAVASHELRTPLTTLDLQVENLRHLIGEQTTSKDTLLAKLTVVERQGNRLGALVETLLDVSQLMAGRMRLAQEELELADIVRETVARLAEQAARVGCDLVVTIQGPVRVQGDRLRIEQILTNLIGNALKFGAGKPIEVSLVVRAKQAEISVRDHGPGIAADDRDRIFERFERAASHKITGGLGLGLWIARELGTALGGSLDVASEPGQGATFTLALPPLPPGSVRFDQAT